MEKINFKKILLIINISAFLVFCFLVNISAETFAKKFTFENKRETVKDLLVQIEKTSEYKFVYNSDIIDLNREITVNINDENIESILGKIFDPSKVSYKISNDKLVEIADVASQQQAVKGVVTDATTGEALIGVNIVVEGTTIGTITDINGKFSIQPSSKNAVLVFSFIGYSPEKVTLATQNEIVVKLTPLTAQLEEVVVVGYGTTKKATLTGSVASTSGTTLKQSPTTNLTNGLGGRLPGLTSIQTNSEPGTDNTTLMIRGSNTLGNNAPLVVIDGIPNRAMERLDPSDIESITVLKDASAAIYGTQAANGVILITTKRGQVGKPTISVSFNQGYNQPTMMPLMENAEQYATSINEMYYYNSPAAGRYQIYSVDDIQKFTDRSDPWGHPNTDWEKTIVKPWSAQNYENMSVSGGTDNMKYQVSVGGRYEDGIYNRSATYFKQYNFRSNVDGKITKNIDFALDVSGRQEDRNFSAVSSLLIFWKGIGGKPNYPAFWPNGDPGPDVETGNNSAVTSTNATGFDHDLRYNLESNLRLNIKIPWVKGLSIQGNGSYDKTFRYDKLFQKPWYLYTWNGSLTNPVTTPGIRGFATPQLSVNAQDGKRLTYNVYATYEKSIAEKHNIKLLLGIESQSGLNNYVSAFRKNYLAATIPELFAGAADTYMTNNGYADQFARRSYFGRVNYNYMQKYLVEFILRDDGSYMFAPGHQYGLFPAVSLGWRISDESFWKDNISFINDFKLRASWGQTGNDRIYYNGLLQEYQYLSTYGFEPDNNVFGTAINKNLYETVVPNPNVTWETANQSNIGFNATILKNLTLEADFFYNLRTDILWQATAVIPVTTGMTLPPMNIGRVSNKGFEGIASYRGKAGELGYSLSLNGSWAKNNVDFAFDTPGIPDYQLQQGKPMNASLRYIFLGIYTDADAVANSVHYTGAKPGDPILKDVNNDGVISALDQVRDTRNNVPRFIGGFNAILNYKGFDLSLLLQGAAGGIVNQGTGASAEIANGYADWYNNHWTPENTIARYPRSTNTNAWSALASNMGEFPTDYIRLKNFEFGYNLPKNLTKKLGIQNFRVYANGQNLLTLSELTKKRISDPEVPVSSVGGMGGYPPLRVVSVGANLTF